MKDFRDCLVKVRYRSGEVGWAIEIPDSGEPPGKHNLVIINNVTVGTELHYGDVVRVKADVDGMPIVDQVLLRQYPQQIALHYPDSEDVKDHYDKLRHELVKHGCIVEGLVPGLLAVASRDDLDVAGIAAGLGYPQPQ